MLLLAALASLPSAVLASEPQPAIADPRGAQQAALQGLVEGNGRFVDGKQAPHILGAERRRELAKGQHPKAIVLSCSDSRVPPEHVFDQQLGEVFVVRTAGNVADGVALGSIEYGVEHLGIPVIVVLGHRSCGAVKAAVEVHQTRAHPHGHVAEVLDLVMPAVREAERNKAPDLLNASIENNVARVARSLVHRSPLLVDQVKAGKLKIIRAVYDLETGKVEFAN